MAVATLGCKAFAANVPPSSDYADIQFFGDLYISEAAVRSTGASATAPTVFAGVQPLLDSAYYNIANFEGVVTRSRIPFVHKSYVLRMPLFTVPMLRAAHIHGVTLANNHSMDLGRVGLTDSMTALTNAGISAVGAGQNLQQAMQPLIVDLPHGSACIFSWSRTLPEEFFAKQNRAGSAFVGDSAAAKAVAACAKNHKYVFVVVHWGQELSRKIQPYQRLLAEAVIKAGATAVIGHHPHVLQKYEVIAGKPVFYSLGNFVFGTVPLYGEQEGMAVRFKLDDKGIAEYEMVPLAVQHSKVKFVPRPLASDDIDPLKELMPSKHSCRWASDTMRWYCKH